jgi:hypothetical protein
LDIGVQVPQKSWHLSNQVPLSWLMQIDIWKNSALGKNLTGLTHANMLKYALIKLCRTLLVVQD